MSAALELKPCPFCGYDAPLLAGSMMQVHCPRCLSLGPFGRTQGEAATAWNTGNAPIPATESRLIDLFLAGDALARLLAWMQAEEIHTLFTLESGPGRFKALFTPLAATQVREWLCQNGLGRAADLGPTGYASQDAEIIERLNADVLTLAAQVRQLGIYKLELEAKLAQFGRASGELGQ